MAAEKNLIMNRKKPTPAAGSTKVAVKRRILGSVQKSVLRIRQDIQSRTRALNAAENADNPTNYLLQLLYNEILNDALLTSQRDNRKLQSFSVDFALVNEAGDIDEEQTAILKKMPATRQFNHAVLDAEDYGYTLLELEIKLGSDGKPQLVVNTIPRTNVVPQNGMFYPDYGNTLNSIKYREVAEFGTWILEYNTGNLGRLNKAAVHVLFKRFAQSCWSELCEIYGIPPRVLKTNTADPEQLNRAEAMMKDMAAAAYFIIDETETFEWATGVNTNGDVYANLISLCRDEISLLYNGAVIGQDTKHGSRGKEQASQNLQWELVLSDLDILEEYWNNTNLPALVNLGFIKPGLSFKYLPAEDIGQLWKFTEGLLRFKQIDNDWLTAKFGVKVIGDRTPAKPDDDNDLKDKKKKEDLTFGNFFD